MIKIGVIKTNRKYQTQLWHKQVNKSVKCFNTLTERGILKRSGENWLNTDNRKVPLWGKTDLAHTLNTCIFYLAQYNFPVSFKEGPQATFV